jgi:hypothetical protein
MNEAEAKAMALLAAGGCAENEDNAEELEVEEVGGGAGADVATAAPSGRRFCGLNKTQNGSCNQDRFQKNRII